MVVALAPDCEYTTSGDDAVKIIERTAINRTNESQIRLLFPTQAMKFSLVLLSNVTDDISTI
jgi:hypothetical protein